MRFYKPPKLKIRPLVSILVAAYDRPRPLRCLLASLAAQTYSPLEVIVAHDGPPSVEVWNSCVDHDHAFQSLQIIHTPERQQGFGHPVRRLALAKATGTLVGFANDDCYYVPVYVHELVHALAGGADIACCHMIHSHKLWQPLAAAPRRGAMDIGNWLARTELVRSVPWTSTAFAADWELFAGMLKRTKKLVQVKKYLYVHN